MNTEVSKNVPKIVVGCPTHELKADSLEKYFEGIESLTYPNFDVIIEDNSPTPAYSEKIKALGRKWSEKNPGKQFIVIHSGTTSEKGRQRLVNGRNKLREMVLKGNYDYFLSLEQDVVPPKNIIETLLSHKKEMVSGVYWNKDTHVSNEPKLMVMAGIHFNEEEKKKNIVRSIGLFQLLPSRLIEVAYTGLGCALISRSLLEKISFRYEENQLACDDVYFCMDAQAQNHKIYLDSSVWCAHYFNDAFKKTEY